MQKKTASELLGITLTMPDIDHDKYEYSGIGEVRKGQWPEYWLENQWRQDDTQCPRDVGTVLSRRPKVRRWRARRGEIYYFVGAGLDAVRTHEVRSSADQVRYEAGNYFESNLLAMQAAMKFYEVLEEMHQENDRCSG